MKNLNSIRNTFIRQSSENDCGLACLIMILIYCGRNDAAASAAENYSIPINGLSLLEMCGLAKKFGLKGRCVSMDTTFLSGINSPVILHVVNEHGEQHFVICYGAIKKRSGWVYFIADPATKAHFVREDELDSLWQSKAALYLEDISFQRPSFRERTWMPLLTISSFPKGLWVTIPFLNLCVTLLGIALSWVLQRGIEDSLAGKKESVIVAVLLLLLIITFFKSMVAYIRQQVLVKLNNAVNEQYLTKYIQKIVYKRREHETLINDRTVKKHLGDIQKIQNAVSGFASVLLSEGSLILFILSALLYAQPLIGIINMISLSVMIAASIKNAPELSYQAARLNEISGRAESQLVNDLLADSGIDCAENRFIKHHRNYLNYLSYAERIATRIGRFNLFYECTGAINALTVFAVSLYKINLMEISYGMLMLFVIASYFIPVLMQKICNAIVVITEGADASRQFKLNTTNS